MNATKPSFNPWPYVIIGYFTVVVISIVMFVGWTTKHNVELVHNDYYKDEVLFQQQIDRVTRTADTKNGATIAYDASARSLVIGLSAAHAAGRPSGKIELYRPSESKLDQATPLRVDAQGVQKIDATNLKPGLWKVRVSWSVEGQDFYSDRPVIIGSKG